MLASAFFDDPAWHYVFPSARRRERLLPWLFAEGQRIPIERGETIGTAGELVGVARWLGPGELGNYFSPRLVAVPLRLGPAFRRLMAYGRAVQRLRTGVAPGPHWYLAGIAVRPERQGEGIGATLLRFGLDRADDDGTPAVLLTNSERNLPFYERHGFAVVAEEDTPAGGPHAWALIRHPAELDSAP